MKGFIYSLFVSINLFVPRLFAGSLPVGMWEGVWNKYGMDYYLLQVNDNNQHRLLVSKFVSQLKHGSIYEFTDNDVSCKNALCHVY